MAVSVHNGRFRFLSKRSEPDIKLSSINWFLGWSVVSWYHFYSLDVLINMICGFLGRIAYSSSLFGFMEYGLIGWFAFVSIRIADFVLFNFLISSNITKVPPSASFTFLMVNCIHLSQDRAWSCTVGLSS
jgi:hypothetical protein